MGRLLDAPISGTGGWSGVAVMVKSRKHGCAAIMSHAPFDISRRLRVGVNLRTFTQTPNAEQLSGRRLLELHRSTIVAYRRMTRWAS